MKNYLLRNIATLSLSLVLLSGCVGFSVPGMDIFHRKPYTIFSEGDEFGRDQLANRFMAANHAIPMKGFSSNTVLTVLGQPQEIEVVERAVSEDWFFVYYHTYKKIPTTDEGVFMVRFYQNKVIDVVKLS